MNSISKALVAIVVIALIIWGISAATSRNGEQGTAGGKGDRGNSSGGQTIKIGVIGPFTGDASAYGEPLRNVVALAIEEVNAAGGVSGALLEAIYEDGKCNGKDAANAMQKLANVDKVEVVLGGFCSGESLASVPIAEAAKVALFSPGSSSPDLTGISPFFFRNYPSDATQGKVLANAARNMKGWKKVAVIQEQSDYALGNFKSFSENFSKLGGTTVREEFPSNTTDFRSILVKLRSQSPDALFINPQTPATGERILKQLSDLNWRPALILNDAFSGDPKTLENNKVILEGALTAEFGTDVSNTKFARLLIEYKDKYAAEMPYQSYGQTEYDAVFMIVDAIKTVGYDGEKIAAWSRTVKDWEGASGKVTIEPSGDRTSGHVLKVIRNGFPEVGR